MAWFHLNALEWIWSPDDMVSRSIRLELMFETSVRRSQLTPIRARLAFRMIQATPILSLLNREKTLTDSIQNFQRQANDCTNMDRSHLFPDLSFVARTCLVANIEHHISSATRELMGIAEDIGSICRAHPDPVVWEYHLVLCAWIESGRMDVKVLEKSRNRVYQLVKMCTAGL